MDDLLYRFEDGNGRIGWSIAEKALSQGIGSPQHQLRPHPELILQPDPYADVVGVR